MITCLVKAKDTSKVLLKGVLNEGLYCFDQAKAQSVDVSTGSTVSLVAIVI